MKGSLSKIQRGTLLLCAGWGVQILSGYVVNIWLGRKLGAAEYGTFGVIMGLLLWIEVGAISGIPSAVQKFVSAQEDRARAIVRSAVRLQLVTVLILFIPSFFLAPFIGQLFNDSRFGTSLQIALLDIWIYSFFFIMMFLQNGLRRFGRHALLISVYSISRLAFVLVLVPLLENVNGAFIANIAGSAVGLILGVYLYSQAGLVVSSSPFSFRDLIKYALPMAFFALAVNLFTSIDLWMVNYFIGGASTGHYTAATTVARVPYYLFFGLSATVLPSVSQSISRRDENEARRTIQSAIRVVLMVIIPLIFFMIPQSTAVIVLLFGESYQAGGNVLGLLIVALSFLAVFFLFSTIINADNRPNVSLLMTAGGVVLDIFLNIWLTPHMGVMGAALATTISVFIAVVFAGFLIVKRFGALVDIRAVIRIVMASLPVLILALMIKVQGAGIILLGAASFILYILVIFNLGETPFRLKKDNSMP